MDLRFTPSFVGKTTGTLEFFTKDNPTPVVIQLLGEGILDASGKVYLYPESKEGYVGDSIDIPIVLKNAANLQAFGITGLNLDFVYNSTLLAPNDFVPTMTGENLASIHLTYLPVIEGVIYNLKFMVCLGNAESTPLYLRNVELIGGDAEIIKSDGVFKLLGLCQDGGTRLLNPNSVIIQSITPNPAETELKVDFYLTEKGNTEILITNILGLVLDKFVYENVDNYGLYQAIFDVSRYSSGNYFITLKTPTVIESKSVMKVK